MSFFIWRRNNASFLRYLGFSVFVKSTDIKICDLIIDISLQKPLRTRQPSEMEPERCSNVKKHLLCVECKSGLIQLTNFHKFAFICKVADVYIPTVPKTQYLYRLCSRQLKGYLCYKTVTSQMCRVRHRLRIFLFRRKILFRSQDI